MLKSRPQPQTQPQPDLELGELIARKIAFVYDQTRFRTRFKIDNITPLEIQKREELKQLGVTLDF